MLVASFIKEIRNIPEDSHLYTDVNNFCGNSWWNTSALDELSERNEDTDLYEHQDHGVTNMKAFGTLVTGLLKLQTEYSTPNTTELYCTYFGFLTSPTAPNLQ